jgi:hypothetical protein
MQDISVLSDADAAALSALVRGRRAVTTVAEAEAEQVAAERSAIVHEWLSVQGHMPHELAVLADATRFDMARLSEPSLVAELCAAVEGDVLVDAIGGAR